MQHYPTQQQSGWTALLYTRTQQPLYTSLFHLTLFFTFHPPRLSSPFNSLLHLSPASPFFSLHLSSSSFSRLSFLLLADPFFTFLPPLLFSFNSSRLLSRSLPPLICRQYFSFHLAVIVFSNYPFSLSLLLPFQSLLSLFFACMFSSPFSFFFHHLHPSSCLSP